jgi:hypothetical protein
MASPASRGVPHPPPLPAGRPAGHGVAGGRPDSPRLAPQSPELSSRHESHRQDLEEQTSGHLRRSVALVRHLHLEATPLPVHRQPLQQRRTGKVASFTYTFDDSSFMVTKINNIQNKYIIDRKCLDVNKKLHIQ